VERATLFTRLGSQ